MMKEIKTLEEIKTEKFVLKYSQVGCMPCKMLQNILDAHESEINADVYICDNIDEAIEFGATTLPVIVVNNGEEFRTILDNDELLDESVIEKINKLLEK